MDFGVVYGSSKTGHGILAYVDPNTDVGPDTYPYFDADDELVFHGPDLPCSRFPSRRRFLFHYWYYKKRGIKKFNACNGKGRQGF